MILKLSTEESVSYISTISFIIIFFFMYTYKYIYYQYASSNEI